MNFWPNKNWKIIFIIKQFKYKNKQGRKSKEKNTVTG